MRPTKNLFSPEKKKKFDLARVRRLTVKALIISTIIFLASYFIIKGIEKFLKSSDYFQIKEVVIKDNAVYNLSYLKGKNIFSIDLNKESEYILEKYPDYRNVRLIRVLPNRLFVDFVKRKPVALAKFYKYFAVDENGVFFPLPEQLDGSDLPLISGLEVKIHAPVSGRAYNIKELKLALNIIEEIKRNRLLRYCKVKKIDVSNPTYASVIIPLAKKRTDNTKLSAGNDFAILEVRLGEEDIRGKIAILEGLIIQEKLNLVNVKYVDLRFNEAVIKLKDAK